MLTRYRVRLMGDRTRDVTRLEQLLEDASIKLSALASTCPRPRRGQCWPRWSPVSAVLAELAKGKMGGKIPAVREALDRHCCGARGTRPRRAPSPRCMRRQAAQVAGRPDGLSSDR